MKIRVLLVDDDPLLCQVLALNLNMEEDIEVVGQAHSAAQTMMSLSALQPDVVAIDVELPDQSGVDVVHTATRLYPNLRAIALSGHVERCYVDRMMTAGAHGYVVKSSVSTMLTDAVRSVCSGKRFLSPEVAGFMVSPSAT